MPQADPARIRELERWHARRDCEEQGHVHPEGYTPAPDAPEPTEIRPWGYASWVRTVNCGPPCERCGTALPTALETAR